ncbi:hypothetical protein [Streptomyces sp. NPDC002054]|uniref:hypothetical protein n=1 Tax=Streptomyces sp. NPDC002054 TaxID=3154663 RepID=UPI00332428E2
MSRAARIGEIRRRREQQARQLDVARTWVTEVLAGLRLLDSLRLELLGAVPAEAEGRLAALGVELGELLEQLPLEAAEIETVAARFRRPTLNVGVIGRARQGKSRMIRSLTGLTEQEIPTSDGSFCTGVTSVIRHEDGVDTQAQVFLHSERSFLHEVIAPYYAELGLGSPPATLDRFAGPLPAEPAERSAADGSRYAHLAGFHEALPAYRALLRTPSPHPVPAGGIRSFVAQADEDETPQHAFRAVRHVRITTHFAEQDWTGLALIDLPGIGDTNLQDAQRIVAALKDEIDVVVFVRRPDALGDGIGTYDHDLYDHVRDGLSDVGLEQCSFLIVNRCSGPKNDNSANADRMLTQWLPASRFEVAEAHIADCSQPAEVAAVMDRVLDHLLTHLDGLDAQRLAARTEKAAELRERTARLLAQAGRLADLAQPSEVWFLPFTTLFKEASGRLATALAAYVRELREEREYADTSLAEAVDAILEAAQQDPGHPSVAQIVVRADAEDGLSVAYGKYLNESRARISRRFLECDLALHTRTERMQHRIAEILKGPGALGALGTAEGADFLAALADRIPKVREQGESEIRYALGLLADFQLSYRGMLQHRVRACLDGLHADTPAMRFPEGQVPTAAQVREMLEVCYDESLYACRAELHKALAEPSAAVFAIVEEFYDRVVSAAGAADEWLVFYQDARAEIWPGRFAALAEDAAHLRRWSETVGTVGALLEAPPATTPAAPADVPGPRAPHAPEEVAR